MSPFSLVRYICILSANGAVYLKHDLKVTSIKFLTCLNGSLLLSVCWMFFVLMQLNAVLTGFLFQKEAESVLSKRLGEVNEELHKSQARNTALQKDLNSTAQVLRAEEAKTAELNNRLKELAAADTSQAGALNSLTAQLQEATARVSELQKLSTDVENQLKESQVIQMQKDKEIQVGHHGIDISLPCRSYTSVPVCFRILSCSFVLDTCVPAVYK